MSTGFMGIGADTNSNQTNYAYDYKTDSRVQTGNDSPANSGGFGTGQASALGQATTGYGTGTDSGIAIGSGNRGAISVSTQDPEVVKAALSANRDVSIGALNVGQSVVESNSETAQKALNISGDALSVTQGLFTNLTTAFEHLTSVGASQAQGVLDSNQTTISALKDLGTITATGGQSETNKTIKAIVYAVVAGIVLLGAGFLFFFRRKAA